MTREPSGALYVMRGDEAGEYGLEVGLLGRGLEGFQPALMDKNEQLLPVGDA